MIIKNYAVFVGAVYLLIGLLGWIFREGFGNIPLYLLVVNIVFGIWGLAVGFASSNRSQPPADLS